MVAVLGHYTPNHDTVNSLSDRHRDELQSGSGISPEEVAASGAWTATSRADLLKLGFKGAQADLAPVMVLPPETLTPGPAPCIIKPDNPRTIDGKKLKYEIAAGARNVLDVPSAVRAAVLDANEPLVFTEGWKKARALASHGVAVVGLSGVWNFAGQTPDGHSAPLEDFRHIPLKGRHVLIVFDSDVSTNLNVRAARERLRDLLKGHGARVQYVDLPPLPDGSKCGADDYLLTHTAARDLFGLAYNPHDGEIAALRAEVAALKLELEQSRQEYQWNRDLDAVPSVALSPGDKLVLRDVRRATRRAGDQAYRDPQTLYYPDRIRFTGQSTTSYGRSLRELDKSGAIELVEGTYSTSGKKSISVVLTAAFDKPSAIRRVEERKSGGVRPVHILPCEDCGPDAGVIARRNTVYSCSGCHEVLRTINQKPTELLRDPVHHAECYPPEPLDEAAVVDTESFSTCKVVEQGDCGDQRLTLQVGNDSQTPEPTAAQPDHRNTVQVKNVSQTPEPKPKPTCHSPLGCLQQPYCGKQGRCPFDPVPPDVLPFRPFTKELRL
jgi:hypothetical protein